MQNFKTLQFIVKNFKMLLFIFDKKKNNLNIYLKI